MIFESARFSHILVHELEIFFFISVDNISVLDSSIVSESYSKNSVFYFMYDFLNISSTFKCLINNGF